MDYVPRSIEPLLQKLLDNAPVIYLNGPRQAGKSTLCRFLGNQFNYITFDKATVQASASSDPLAFISNLPPGTIIDEIQLVPEIFRPIKYLIDELRLAKGNTVTGHFILTGSANIMALPKLAESLVGRMQALTLLPFSAAEVLRGHINFISQIFEKPITYKVVKQKLSLYQIVQRATFPEVASGSLIDPIAWYENYVSNIINRDIKTLADIDKISSLPRMLTLLANRAGNLLSHASFARDMGLPVSTYKRYLELFEHVFLVALVKPWFKNASKRLVKSPKVYLTDTALLLALLGRASLEDYAMKGAILENFVASELTKHLNCLQGYQLFHFRTSDAKEVDFIIERSDGAVIGIEVKYSATVIKADFNGLKVFKEMAGRNFVKGVVLYQGEEILPFGENLWAIPLSCLWSGVLDIL